MKKKITPPDGTVVEYEGTAEELAELEESLDDPTKNENTDKGKRLLVEQDVMRMIEKALDKHRMHECHHVRNPYQVVPAPWYPQPTVWYGSSTSDKVSLLPDNVNVSDDGHETAGIINTNKWSFECLS